MFPIFKLRPLAAALISVMALQGCATHDKSGRKLTMGESFKETFNSDDPCSSSKRNIGIAVGAITGAVIGGVVSGDKNKTLGILVGALAGSGLGALIGHEIDNRQCEISKVQQKYGVDIEMTKLSAEVPVGTDQAAKTNEQASLSKSTQNIGLSVSVVDKEGKPQFSSNSADIQPDSRAMFAEIAQKYVTPRDDKNKKLAEAIKTRRVLLIGHTDDSGSSQLNADLSERRAKSVAKLFKEAGVPEGQIYYQGAGETLPMADNTTPEGRAKNRRVEIVDLNDETSFKAYLANRRPNTAYYRPAEKIQSNRTNTPSKSVEEKTNVVVASGANKKSNSTQSVTVPSTKVASQAKITNQKSKAAGMMLDFGGKPFSSSEAKLNAGDLIAPKKTSFSLISEANASDMTRIETCNIDRPRNAGLVKSLKDGSEYKTTEYLPGLYGRTWYDMVGGNLVVLNKVAVLRDGATPANKPELKIYSNYKSGGKEPRPDVSLTPDVNTYQTTNGIVYRVFANGKQGVQCLDVLMPLENQQSAKEGKLVYGDGAEFVSDFKPKMKN